MLDTRSASPALTAVKKSCVSLTGFSSAVKVRTKEAGSVLFYPDLADRPGLSQWTCYRPSFAGAPRRCSNSSMDFESFRNCPWALSQTPSRRKGMIVAAAQALARPVTFSSGSQRNSCIEMKKATADPPTSARSSARSCQSVEALTSARCKPVTRYRSEEHTSELQSLAYLVCRILLEKKNTSELQSLAYLVCRLLLEKKTQSSTTPSRSGCGNGARS